MTHIIRIEIHCETHPKRVKGMVEDIDILMLLDTDAISFVIYSKFVAKHKYLGKTARIRYLEEKLRAPQAPCLDTCGRI